MSEGATVGGGAASLGRQQTWAQGPCSLYGGSELNLTGTGQDSNASQTRHIFLTFALL